MDWKPNRCEIINLIDLYRSHECLWNFKSHLYKRKDAKNKSWRKISDAFNKPIDEIKRKLKSLRTAYVFERKKVQDSYKSGCGVYVPSLFYYHKLAFLDDAIILRNKAPNVNKESLHHKQSESLNEANSTEFIDASSISFQESNERIENSFEKTSSDSSLKQPKPKRRKLNVDDERSEEDSNYLKNNACKILQKRDDFSVYGEHVANQIRNLHEKKLQYIAQHRINNILFQLSMKSCTSSSISTNISSSHVLYDEDNN